MRILYLNKSIVQIDHSYIRKSIAGNKIFRFVNVFEKCANVNAKTDDHISNMKNYHDIAMS